MRKISLNKWNDTFIWEMYHQDFDEPNPILGCCQLIFSRTAGWKHPNGMLSLSHKWLCSQVIFMAYNYNFLSPNLRFLAKLVVSKQARRVLFWSYHKDLSYVNHSHGKYKSYWMLMNPTRDLINPPIIGFSGPLLGQCLPINQTVGLFGYFQMRVPWNCMLVPACCNSNRTSVVTYTKAPSIITWQKKKKSGFLSSFSTIHIGNPAMTYPNL